MNERSVRELVAEEDREWVRELVAKYGLTEEIEAEAQQRLPSRTVQDIAVRVGVAAILFFIAAGTLRFFGVPWWTYFIAGAASIAISK